MGKTFRRGDKSDSSSVIGKKKIYLQEPLPQAIIPLERCIKRQDLINLPDGIDRKEWLASNTIGFFENINTIYGSIAEFCTRSACPDMIGPAARQYLWQDEKVKKLRLSASQYIDYIMTYCQKTINDENIFPTKHGNEFPSNFEVNYIRKMFRLLFHVIAHVYQAHFREIVLLQLHAHLNALFAHFVGFSYSFSLIEEKELEVLGDLIVALKIIPTQPHASTSGNEPLDNTVLGSITSEENKENNPLLSATSLLSGNQNPINSDITTSELHSDASNSSSHGTENLADNSGGIQADQSSQCVKSDSAGSPMEGIEEGTCNGNDISNSVMGGKNEIGTGSDLNHSTKMSTNCQVDMNMS